MPAPSRMSSDFCVAVGEELRVEVDVAEEDDNQCLLWATAKVSTIDSGSGQFYVMVDEWAGLDPDDLEYEEAYAEGPFTAAQEGNYIKEFEGRWLRAPTVASAWNRWPEAVCAAAGGQSGAWWTQDDRTVTMAFLLPAGCSFKRDVQLSLSGDRLALEVVTDAGSRPMLKVDGAFFASIVPTGSTFFVEDTAPQGFKGFWESARFLVVTVQKASVRVGWESVVLTKDQRPPTMVSVASNIDGVTITRRGRRAVKTAEPSSKSKTESGSSASGAGSVAADPAPDTDSSVTVTIRRKPK